MRIGWQWIVVLVLCMHHSAPCSGAVRVSFWDAPNHWLDGFSVMSGLQINIEITATRRNTHKILIEADFPDVEDIGRINFIDSDYHPALHVLVQRGSLAVPTEMYQSSTLAAGRDWFGVFAGDCQGEVRVSGFCKRDLRSPILAERIDFVRVDGSVDEANMVSWLSGGRWELRCGSIVNPSLLRAEAGNIASIDVVAGDCLATIEAWNGRIIDLVVAGDLGSPTS